MKAKYRVVHHSENFSDSNVGVHTNTIGYSWNSSGEEGMLHTLSLPEVRNK